MAVYKIVEYGNEILRGKAKTVPRITNNVLKLLGNMADTLYSAQGAGLAAPQVGVAKRVVVIDAGEGLVELINPEIIAFAGQETASEGCLSMPGTLGEVTRAATVKVKYLDRHGQEQIVQARDLFARAIQHEVDHLDGVLFIDRAQRIWKMEE